MPRDQTEAVVLRSAAFADQDKIVTFFSRDKGLVRGVAKGARKFGNRFGSLLEPLTFVTVFYYEKERRDLVTVSGCDLIESFFETQKDPAAAATLAYFAELIEEFFPARSREDLVFRLLLATLRALKAGGNRALLARYFEAWFLRINGLLPDVRKCRRCRRPLDGGGFLSGKKDGLLCTDCADYRKDAAGPELGRFLDWALKNPPPAAENPALCSQDELRAVGRVLQGIITFHLEREPKTLRCLRE
ncbi:MAG: DNA repair protein RecO [Candidatus Aminicenantes bacterium]|nr:DNA repair protein RecO [Candidatus Aminicenantes bacterium]